MAATRTRRDPMERFLEKIAIDDDGCWIWCSTRLRSGYGQFRPGGTAPYEYAHRWSWEAFTAESIPEFFDVRHRCDKPSCVNPDCLFVGTRLDNMRDAAAKGRTSRANAAKTHCLRGHEFTETNTAWNRAHTERSCRTCKRDQMREYRANRRG